MNNIEKRLAKLEAQAAPPDYVGNEYRDSDMQQLWNLFLYSPHLWFDDAAKVIVLRQYPGIDLQVIADILNEEKNRQLIFPLDYAIAQRLIVALKADRLIVDFDCLSDRRLFEYWVREKPEHHTHEQFVDVRRLVYATKAVCAQSPDFDWSKVNLVDWLENVQPDL